MNHKRIYRIQAALLAAAMLAFTGCSKTSTDIQINSPEVTASPSISVETATPEPTEEPTEPPTEAPTEDPMMQYLEDIEVDYVYDSVTERLLVTITNRSPYVFSGEIVIYITNIVDFNKSEIVPITIQDLGVGNSEKGTINYKVTSDHRISYEFDSYSFTESTFAEGELDPEFAAEIQERFHLSFGTTTWEPALIEYVAYKISDDEYRLEVTTQGLDPQKYQQVAVALLHYDDLIKHVTLFDSDGNILITVD